MSHEIKTPLAVIQNYAKLLQTEGLDEHERREYSQAILVASLRLNALITNILKLNKLENQRIRIKPQDFDLSAQLTECLLGFEQIWEEKQIEIIPEIQEGVRILSEKELLSVVWNNLLSNAFKFTDPGGFVRINFQESEELIYVTVQDSGCGISADSINGVSGVFSFSGDPSGALQT